MSLLNEAREEQKTAGTPCALRRLQEAKPDLYTETLEALASDVSCSAIARALDKRGEPISRLILERHRRGDCQRCRS